jgi:hypothetical protein
MRAKPDVVEAWMQYGDAYLRESIFHEPCSGWYRGNSDGEKKLRTIWPGTMLHCLELMQDVPWEDFEFTRLEGEEEGPARQSSRSSLRRLPNVARQGSTIWATVLEGGSRKPRFAASLLSPKPFTDCPAGLRLLRSAGRRHL